MLLILGLFCVAQCFYHGTLARPAPVTVASPTELLARASPPNLSGPSQRSIWDIVWACLVTMIACSWVSAHPNVPDPKQDSIFYDIYRRLKIMFWALIAPEIIIMWAMRQFYGARRIRNEINAKYPDKRWTLVHAHFLQMGGLTYSNGDRREVLSFDRFNELLSSGQMSFPEIDEDELQDKNKSDPFSKFVAVFQTTWFIVQCIARAAQRLPVTQLELATVALAALNALIYAFWWYKPQDVQRAINIKLEEHSSTNGKEPSSNEKETRILPRVSILRLIPNLVWRIDFDKGATSVPTLYSIDPDEPGGSDKFFEIVIFGSIVGTVFGAIHCIGWRFEFPSRVETILWRSSSLVVTVIPVLLIVAEVTYRVMRRTVVTQSRKRSLSSTLYCGLSMILGRIYRLLSIASVFLYIAARFILLAEAVVSLRQLPHNALDGVQWALAVPHTG